jgi:2-oxoglutarate dehydrogenase E2 component (dihydrolipoamide succinyltransferase)
MRVELRVPVLGETMLSARVGRWHRAAGEAVGTDEPLVELITDKADVQLYAPAAGVLREIAAPAGETVAIGALLAVIEG